MQVATTQLMSGEAFQQLCDVYCGSHYDLHRNPVIATQTAKHLDIDGLVCEWDNPRLLKLSTHALEKGFESAFGKAGSGLPNLRLGWANLCSPNEDFGRIDKG